MAVPVPNCRINLFFISLLPLRVAHRALKLLNCPTVSTRPLSRLFIDPLQTPCHQSKIAGINWCPRPELNWDPRFRKPLLYPFELRGRSAPGHHSDPAPLDKRCLTTAAVIALSKLFRNVPCLTHERMSPLLFVLRRCFSPAGGAGCREARAEHTQVHKGNLPVNSLLFLTEDAAR